MKNWLKTYLEEILILLGFAAITYGVAQIYAPAAWIVGGVLAIAWAYLHARASQPVEELLEDVGDDQP